MTEQAKQPEVEVQLIERPDAIPPEVEAYVAQIEAALSRAGAELDASDVAEARGIVFGDLWGVATDSEGVKHEIKFNVTCRSMVSGQSALADYLSLLTFAKSMHIYPYLPTTLAVNGSRTVARQQAQAPTAQAPVAPEQPQAPTPDKPYQQTAPSAPAGGNGGSEVKSALVKKIIVEKPGSVKVYYTDQYCVQSHIGAEGISKFFDASLGWTPDHFSKPAIYPEDQVGNLTVEWAKNEKGYNDIQRIYVA